MSNPYWYPGCGIEYIVAKDGQENTCPHSNDICKLKLLTLAFKIPTVNATSSEEMYNYAILKVSESLPECSQCTRFAEVTKSNCLSVVNGFCFSQVFSLDGDEIISVINALNELQDNQNVGSMTHSCAAVMISHLSYMM